MRAAYTTSLESQISGMRDELAAAYKAQSQATQRLIAVNDTMHRHEEQTRLDADTIQRLNDELGMLRRKVSQHTEILSEKDRSVQVPSFPCFEAARQSRLTMSTGPKRRARRIDTRDISTREPQHGSQGGQRSFALALD